MPPRKTPFVCTEKEYFDLPCSPYPASGEVTIQGEIHPPTKVGTKIPDNGDADYIVYNRCLVFTKEEEKSSMTIAKKFNSLGKARRLGSVPPIFSNWCDRAMFGKTSPRLVGISYEGVPNGKDAKNFPTESGRMAVLISGAASVVVDTRFLKDPNGREPTFGDYLEWIPTDSGGRIRPGAEKYGTCIVRVVKREQLSDNKADKGVRTLSKMKAAQSIPGYHELNPEEQSFLDGVVTSAAMEMDSSVHTSERLETIDIKALKPLSLNDAKKVVYDFGQLPVQNDRIFGVFLEQVPGTAEVRVLLRPHGVC